MDEREWDVTLNLHVIVDGKATPETVPMNYGRRVSGIELAAAVIAALRGVAYADEANHPTPVVPESIVISVAK